MLKLVGSGCVMGSGLWLLWKITAEEHRRISVLRDLTGALETMADEIRMNRTPMPRLLLKAGEGRVEEIMAFFAAVRLAGESLGLAAAWRRAADALPLPRREMQILSALGTSLTGDEEQACRGLLSAAQQLSGELKRHQEATSETTRRNAALCLSGAALTIILLI